MEKLIKVIGLGGSLAPKSTSLTALKIALEGAEEAGAQTKMFDIGTLKLPMYIPGARDVPEQARILSEAVYEAAGLLWSSPMYQGASTTTTSADPISSCGSSSATSYSRPPSSSRAAITA